MIRKMNPGSHGPRVSSNPTRGFGRRKPDPNLPPKIDRIIDARPEVKVSNNSQYTSSRNKLRIIPMGGVEEVGENMTAIEFGDDIIIVDMGHAFPDETMPGIDYIIPNTEWLESQRHRIRAVLVTHGHMDHIGGMPYILPKLGYPPVYTMQLTAAFIKKRLEEFGQTDRVQINAITKEDVLKLGNFTIRFVGVNHNIPDGVALSILTPVGQIIYATDWKFDHSPVDGRTTEFEKLARFGGEGVLLLMSDSTNSFKPGYAPSERELGKNIDRVFAEASGRLIFATFSSLVSRIQQAFDAAAKNNRKVMVVGRSMINTVEIALSMGYLKIQPKLIIKSEQARKFPDNQIVILTTGSQGEEGAGLARMARGEHKLVHIKKGDTAILSSSPIPGNERAVAAVMSNLTRLGANVVYNKMLDIHSSGHAHQEELKLMMNLTRPKYFMPIHGEHHMLVEHGRLAQQVGITEDRIFIPENGSAVEFDLQGNGKVAEGRVAGGYVYVDGLGVNDVNEVVIRDRKQMASDGMFVIIATINKQTGKLESQDIISRGFVYMKDNDELIREVKHEVRKLTESKGKEKLEPNWVLLRQTIRDEVGEYLFQKTERRPMILPVIIEV